MNLIAKANYFYAGRRLRAGDHFVASDRDGRVLLLLKRAEARGQDPEEALQALREQAKAFGVEVDRRWREARLRSEIANVRASYSTRRLKAEE